MRVKLYILLFFFFGSTLANAQSKFKLLGNVKEQVIPFELVNNIIIMPMEINGKELSFILDSGANKSLLFNLNPQDSLSLYNVNEVELFGLGKGTPIKALHSKKNKFRYKNVYSTNQDVYVIFNDHFNLSSKLGKTIHGVIGAQFFKDFLVEIDYQKKRLLVSKSKRKKRFQKCRKCDVIPLNFHNKRPFVTVLNTQENTQTKARLLVDTGSSDAFWLFESDEIKLPKKNFNDFLGVGLNGNILGVRSRLEEVTLGKFLINKPNVAFPDSLSIPYKKVSKRRNGSLGGEVLSRFKVVFDYKHKRMFLKRNSKFNQPFKYNMSGLEVVFSGKTLVRELVEKPKVDSNEFSLASKTHEKKISFTNHYEFQFKPTYRINFVREDSPAFFAGLQANDDLLKINGKTAYHYTLSEIYELFYSKENRKIKLLIRRNGIEMKFDFRLKKLL